MDVDTPNILKRCSSAPLINEAASTAATSPTTNTAPRSTSFFSMFTNNSLPRTRSNSISCSPLSAAVNIPGSIQSTCGRRLTPRVNQLRAEECADVSNTREVAHEREVHTAMQMGQSYEDLTLLGGPANSPTRVPRFSPVVSPSPTRKYTTRRSLSPIALRASSFSPVRPNVLVGKRRCDDGDASLCKRMCTGRLTPSTPGTPDSDSLECTFRPVSPRGDPPRPS
ncbi:P2R1A-PPP2R2A-interacting phosphatase regulator 1 isoform X1 [Vanessa tameamea]|uniref:P2R1A-PPP2R2A-interacting phosphatase regulator 1 isoform X1 n=2 Tax=Vanessa tameamea TaxID=334116 RepID=A0A8B8HZM8_VANTA|nr:protein FAM122A isoform X3 [Vanessa tameamea]XP_047544928.1 P2R1A-PPP2R2A-interacting phosphatase regulator 1 [Vanessa atalanta]